MTDEEVWTIVEERLRNHPPGMTDEEVTELVSDLRAKRVHVEIWDLRDKIAPDDKVTRLSKEMRASSEEVRIVVVRKRRDHGEPGDALRGEFVTVKQAEVLLHAGAHARGRLQQR